MSRAPKESLLKRFGRSVASATDSVVEAFNPSAGIRRKSARRKGEFLARRHQVRMQSIEFKDDVGGSSGSGGFESGERGRLDASWLYGSLHPDSALEESLVEMRAKSNSAYKNHELFAGHVIRRVQRVAGTGIMLAPQIVAAPGKITDDQAKEWNKTLRDSFERWAHKAGGPQIPLYMIQRQVVRHIEKDGVAWVQFGDVPQSDPRIPINLRMKVIHPRRIETPPEFAMDPKVRHGQRFNKDGDVIGRYVRVADADDVKNFSIKYDYVPAFFDNGLPRMVQVCELHEAGQTIGYPQGQVSLRRFKNIDEYGEAEIERNIIASCTAGYAIGADPAAEAGAASGYTDSRGRQIEDIAPGRIKYLDDVDNVVFSNPPGPQNAFDPFVTHEARMAACGLGTSLPMMSGNWGGISYSEGKLLWIDEQSPIDCMQMDLIELLLIPMWQNFVNRCVNTGVIDVLPTRFRQEPHLFERVKFVPPKRQSIDPARERASVLSDIAAGIIVHSDDVEQMNGRPAEDVYADIKRNIDQLAEIGITLDMLSPKGGTPLGGTNPTAAEGGAGRKKREAVGAGT